MKRVAILGDPNSIWIKTFVKEVLAKLDVDEIVIFSDREIADDDKRRYPNNVKFIICKGGKVLSMVQMIIAFICKPKFDFLHIQYVNRRKLIISAIIKCKANHIITTFWGFDV